MSIEGERVLLVLIYQPLVANQQEIRCFVEELTAQFEELHTDECDTVVLGDFNLDQCMTLTLTYLTIFLVALLLPSV